VRQYSIVNILSFAVSKSPLSLIIITRAIIATMIIITDVINNLTFYGQVRKEHDIITETKDVTQLNIMPSFLPPRITLINSKALFIFIFFFFLSPISILFLYITCNQVLVHHRNNMCI